VSLPKIFSKIVSYWIASSVLQTKYILSTVTIDEQVKSRLTSALEPGWEYKMDGELNGAELENVEVLLLGGSWLTVDHIRTLKNLRMIQSFSAGVDHVNFGIIPEHIIVCANSGAFAGPIAEFVFGAVISLGRNFEQHDKEMRGDRFIRKPLGLYLKEKTIGILGTGGIGQDVAKLAKVFGMRSIGVNTSGNAAPDFDEVTTTARLDSVLKRSDVIVVAVPLTLKTRNLLGQREFSYMKSDCIIVNIARGAIINEQALYEFLRDHPKAKAALDVWWNYPKAGEEKVPQNCPISSLPNVLSSPHFSDGVYEQLKLGSEGAVANILRYIRKDVPLKGVVRREDYLAH
jgi:D-3-phosphoglycerate dehydrogenase / 2-oxoglutarate reductase